MTQLEPDTLLYKLKVEVDGLHALLAKPEPGIATWCLMVGQKWEAIAKLWGGKQWDEEGDRRS